MLGRSSRTCVTCSFRETDNNAPFVFYITLECLVGISSVSQLDAQLRKCITFKEDMKEKQAQRREIEGLQEIAPGHEDGGAVAPSSAPVRPTIPVQFSSRRSCSLCALSLVELSLVLDAGRTGTYSGTSRRVRPRL